jgi:hypothetical protein
LKSQAGHLPGWRGKSTVPVFILSLWGVAGWPQRKPPGEGDGKTNPQKFFIKKRTVHFRRQNHKSSLTIFFGFCYKKGRYIYQVCDIFRVKSTYILVALAALLIGTVVTGSIILNELYRSIAPSTCEEVVSEISKIWLPEVVSDYFYNDEITIHFDMINGNTITVHGTAYDEGIRDLRCERESAIDFEVWMSDVTAIELATSTKPITTAVTRWKSGFMEVVAYGPENQKKLEGADKLVEYDNEPVPEKIREYLQQFIE